MWDNIDIKVKGSNIVVSTTGVTGKEKILTVAINKVHEITWAKDPLRTLITVLVEKGHNEAVAKLATANKKK